MIFYKVVMVIVHMLVTFLMLIRISLMLLHYHHSYGQSSKYYHCLLSLENLWLVPHLSIFKMPCCCWSSDTMLDLSFSVLMGNGGIPIQGTVPVLMQLTTHGGFVCTSAWSWALFGSLHASTISWWVPLGISFASRIFVDSIFSIRQIILETLSNGDIEMFIGPFSHLCCSLEQWCYRHV